MPVIQIIPVEANKLKLKGKHFCDYFIFLFILNN